MDLITYALCKKQIASALEGAGALVGKPGESAYEIAVKAGYEGTEEEWLNSLRGETGHTPYIGDNGNWWINGIDTGSVATNGIKLTSIQDSSEVIIDEEHGTISSIVNGNTVLVADVTQRIPNESIEALFGEGEGGGEGSGGSITIETIKPILDDSIYELFKKHNQ